jgi:hypothetical protein
MARLRVGNRSAKKKETAYSAGSGRDVAKFFVKHGGLRRACAVAGGQPKRQENSRS